MVDLTTKRQEELGLESVVAPPAESTQAAKNTQAAENTQAIPQSKKLKTKEPELSPAPSNAAMPHINRPHQPGPAVKITQEHAEILAFQRLRQKGVQAAASRVVEPRTDSRTAARPKSKPNVAAKSATKARTGGFVGETILDKFVNALLTVVRSTIQFLAQRLLRIGKPKGPEVIVRQPKPKAKLEQTNSIGQGPLAGPRAQIRKRYFPKRSL